MFKEPKLTYLVLDYKKPVESETLLKSLRSNTKFNHKIIYLHNGVELYPQKFLVDGLIDQLIITQKNDGLGIGTRNLFAAAFSEFCIYVQNDQILGREFVEDEFDFLRSHLDVEAMLDPNDTEPHKIMSISLAGAPCGPNIYSERAHLIETRAYRAFEIGIPLSEGGAGPYHDIEWREGQIQKHYKANRFIHWNYPNPLFIDNGRTAIRQNPDGSTWKHFPDTKQLWLISGPVKEKFVYPKFTEDEWDEVIKTQKWPDGKIPSNEIKDSFHVWN